MSVTPFGRFGTTVLRLWVRCARRTARRRTTSEREHCLHLNAGEPDVTLLVYSDSGISVSCSALA